ncbi:trans-2-enoyl-CoA reductase: mitochondrial-like protein [Dinothrombium tinctorium]|uniref:Enoyl-[acyl-carrier-protein] reductase, mitochondrial n=1 Tax=Dinothrombium tinctorium TaxID=1965070 RepID=A0A443QE08_9ACAR|nr:trans-2-enoyl-CoA reductase: mitochondrial-like protein [Dinothrombium tinctorium]
MPAVVSLSDHKYFIIRILVQCLRNDSDYCPWFCVHKMVPSSSKALIHRSFGQPENVIEISETPLEQGLSANEVLVRFLASPVNPADVIRIKGVYAIKPPLPAIGGNDGVAEIIKCGPDVKQLKVGDWVIPSLPGFGTWRTYAVGKEDDFDRIDKQLDMMTAAQLSVNPCTAYRMLEDFVDLKPGDSLIQNGANSAVGVYVIQLAKLWKINTINVVRDRENLSELVEELKQYGADYVVTEDDLSRNELMDQIWKQVPKPKLALDCIGGKNASDCLRHLDFRGTMIIYGSMTKQPLTIPASSLIYNDQKFKGYWMTRWRHENQHSPEKSSMLEFLSKAFKDGKLKSAKTIPVNLSDYKQAFEKIANGKNEGKIVFVMNE